MHLHFKNTFFGICSVNSNLRVLEIQKNIFINGIILYILWGNLIFSPNNFLRHLSISVVLALLRLLKKWLAWHWFNWFRDRCQLQYPHMSLSVFFIAVGFIMSKEYCGRCSKNGRRSGGFPIESGNSVFEPTVTTGQVSFMFLQVYWYMLSNNYLLAFFWSKWEKFWIILLFCCKFFFRVSKIKILNKLYPSTHAHEHTHT